MNGPCLFSVIDRKAGLEIVHTRLICQDGDRFSTVHSRHAVSLLLALSPSWLRTHTEGILLLDPHRIATHPGVPGPWARPAHWDDGDARGDDEPRGDARGTKGLSPALWQHSSHYQRVLGDVWLRRKARGEALKQAQLFYFVSLPRMMHGLAGSQLGKVKMKPTCEGAFLNAFISPLSAGAFFQEIRPSGHAQGNCVWNSF